jgi:dTDP-4-dehydrorhamnose 3,5-epimerase
VRFVETAISGVVLIELELLEDDRGFFARSYSQAGFAEHGLLAPPVEINVSYNYLAGTLRGMHYQADPVPDPKLVRCTAGTVFDVAVDLRPDSPTHLKWFGHTLSAANRHAVHVPAGCAHGFITLEDASEVVYLMGAPYQRELARGVRWDDPAFAIEWPRHPEVISSRDAAFPLYAQ